MIFNREPHLGKCLGPDHEVGAHLPRSLESKFLNTDPLKRGFSDYILSAPGRQPPITDRVGSGLKTIPGHRPQKTPIGPTGILYERCKGLFREIRGYYGPARPQLISGGLSVIF